MQDPTASLFNVATPVPPPGGGQAIGKTLMPGARRFSQLMMRWPSLADPGNGRRAPLLLG